MHNFLDLIAYITLNNKSENSLQSTLQGKHIYLLYYNTSRNNITTINQ